MNKVLEFLKHNIGRTLGEYAPPFSRFLNGTIEEAEEGRLVMRFRCEPAMLNPAGLMHGGVHASIIDEMTGLLVASLNTEHLYVSHNLYVDFFGKVREGEEVRAEARLVKQGRTVINTECHIYNSEGRLVSRGVCNLVNTGQPKVIG
ncbi:MAG: PaaI family thioesterase [Flavobacteriales bacterium]|nr:PaaI family thioesterase [Flavobacteriales bacterium]MDW8410617.1 PaaI family thioesterase [Flavobacteriales bacterium]